MHKNISSRILTGSAWAFGLRIVGIFSSVIISGLLARLLTPSDLGAYYLVMSFVALMAILSSFGIPVLVVKDIAKAIGINDLSQAKAMVVVAFKSVLFLSICVFLVLNLGVGTWLAESFFHSQEMLGIIFVISLLVIVRTLHGLMAEVFRGFHDIRLASLFGGIAVSIPTMLFLWLAQTSQAHIELTQVMNLVLLASFLVFLLSGYLLLMKVRGLSAGKSIMMKEKLFSGWAIVIMSLTVLVSSQGVLWWLAWSGVNQEKIAVYGIVLQLINMLMLSHSTLISVAQSTMAELKAKNDLKKLEQLVQGMSTITFLLVFVGFVIFVVWGKTILTIIYGSYYVSGYLLLLLVSSFYVVGSLFGASGMLLMMTGHEKILMKIVLLTVLLRFIFAMVLGHDYGLYGVAIAWGAGGLIQNIWVWLTVKKKLGLSSHANFKINFMLKRVLK